MKKLLLTLILCLLVGCSSSTTQETTSNTKEIGILQLMTHDALDKSREGFIDALKDEQMANDTDYGLMIWDGESKGTFYVTFTAEKKYFHI